MELLSCPFCGGYADDTITKQTRCGNSGCIMSKFWHDVEFWNTRTLPDEVEQLIEAVNTFISASREDAETIIPAAEWGIMKQALTACQHLRNKGE